MVQTDRVATVCHGIYMLADDPRSQTTMAEKIHKAMGHYLLTGQLLPDH